ncbi:NUDIX domain-containing protein [Candidatus Woesearchaeota archaeon]|jgi:ADP-ribose pyrophosphatase YjhB (NUDIX family)|nr:NUDIX domain-containing protein [Candidatus Woesearchaeota archaeon]MBT5272522.1 NUDIX domain-containing protein [Candidatus Woesearchaeota archaeon]MBT6041470.1 NUDIX domain-containing protein [Candidatus Woesearchaeota archaeon]MBT6336384.1 NUDIX domain-containing protein [Candidatus Woesearchaeota archaeon]MBT7927705.1 NUDIX domain-containing protein [Candidatus Woesearchaeota archaeon]
MNSRTIVSAIIEKDNKLLFGRKSPNIGPYPNTWHLLGGGMKKNETFESAVRREVKEEANIDVEIIEKVGVDEDDEPNKHGQLTHYIFHVYKVRYISGEIKPGDDITELKWIDKDKINELDLCRPSKKLFSD